MILRLLTKLKMQIIVMPAWMAGIQVRMDASGKTSMLTWIPAVHAGMTQSRGSV
jgi:hypothetical protein